MKYFFLLLFLAAFPSEASELTEACRENETQADLNSCARIKWQAADNALHEFTSGYIERLDPNQAELFNSAHAGASFPAFVFGIACWLILLSVIALYLAKALVRRTGR